MSKSPFGSVPMKGEGQKIKYDPWETTMEEEFYKWCKVMYPQAIKEFKAVQDVERSVDG